MFYIKSVILENWLYFGTIFTSTHKNKDKNFTSNFSNPGIIGFEPSFEYRVLKFLFLKYIFRN
jgi:hypothetical protein